MEEHKQSMKNILILGDSWGVPFYAETYDLKPEHHTEYLLTDLGYKVFNYSLNGGSNLNTILYAKYALTLELGDLIGKLKEESDILNKRNTYTKKLGTKVWIPIPNYQKEEIDWVVWFHTEVHRTTVHRSMWPYLTLDEMYDIGRNVDYRAFRAFMESIPKAKSVVIGGQAPIDPILYEYHKPTHVIEDWRSDILGKKMPFCHNVGQEATAPLIIGSVATDLKKRTRETDIEMKTEKIKDTIYILDAMKNSKDFPDNHHPGAKCHEDLTKRLHSWFMES